MMKNFGILLACLLFASAADRLAAHSLIPMSLEELTEQADAIVHGTVVGKECRRDEFGGIYTIIELQAAEHWKGSANSDTVLIYQAGGVLGERRVIVYPQLEYQLGEEIVCFLARNPRGEYVTMAHVQGKFLVYQAEGSAQKLAWNPFHGLQNAETSPVALQSAGPPSSNRRAPLPLAALKSRITEGGK